MARQVPSIRHHPFSDRVVRLVDAIVRPTVNSDGSLARWRFGRVHLTGGFEHACNLDTEVAQYRRSRLCRMVVEENVVTIGPQAWPTSNEIPDLADGRSPRQAHRARHDLAPNRGQLAGVNSL